MNKFPNAYLLHSENMAKISADNFSDDELAKQYGELMNRETWDEICKTSRMPAMLHKGPCTRKNEANAFECDKILDERLV